MLNILLPALDQVTTDVNCATHNVHVLPMLYEHTSGGGEEYIGARHLSISKKIVVDNKLLLQWIY